MDTARIADLLRPYLAEAALRPKILDQLQCYLDLLQRWNARINLTAVRDPEEIVTKHFGESLFAARILLDGARTEQALRAPSSRSGTQPNKTAYRLADVGSGAGFPGIPTKLFAPDLALTLIESHNKKATFLREAIRALALDNAEVFSGRAERWGKTAGFVTLRAVERFERALPAAAKLVDAGGKLCLLVGAGQIPAAQEILAAGWRWELPELVPQSNERVVLVASAELSSPTPE